MRSREAAAVGVDGRQELGDFLRSRRLCLDPAAVDLPAGRRRRTQGLRREEVAARAGIGTDWYVRLEQGRDVSPSATTINALARALMLSDAERAHLHVLAHTAHHEPFVRETVPPALSRILREMVQPAYITGQRWDLLDWNKAATDLFMDFATLPPARRNILAYMLTEPSARSLFGDTWAKEARRMVAQFRADYGAWTGDPLFAELIALLESQSPEFSDWWNAREIKAQAAGAKTLKHPRRGLLIAEYATLQANDDRRLKLVLYRVSKEGSA